MLNFKSNVYKYEWLELVFAHRNKLYGAYELRQGYSSRLVKAMLMASSMFIAIITGPFLYDKFIDDVNTNLKRVPALDKIDEHVVYVMPKALPKQPSHQAAALFVKAQTINYTAFKPVPAEEATAEVPAVEQLNKAIIGSQTSTGDQVAAGANNIGTSNGNGDGDENNTAPESNQPFLTAEVMPEFPGGLDAFSKYLSKNLRYPSQALENNIQGRVIVSFIVETNGALSDVHILKGIGKGCDEEAMRVLKKAPAWRPGEQNGRKVRVQYNVPIVFNLGD